MISQHARQSSSMVSRMPQPVIGRKAQTITPGPLWSSLALRIEAEDSPLEREADAVAGQILSSPARVQRKCAECEREEEEHHIQRQAETGTGADPAAIDGTAVGTFLASDAGRPLDAGLRDYFEPRFGQDFRGVRIHTGERASESTRSIHALAYTTGSHVVFRSHVFAPSTESGRRLLAHELTHVVQQRGSSRGLIQRQWTREECSTGIFPRQSPSSLPASSLTLKELRKQDPVVASVTEHLFADYTRFTRRIEPVLDGAGVTSRRSFEILLQCRAHQQVMLYWTQLTTAGQFDGGHIAVWSDYVTHALDNIAPLISALARSTGRDAGRAAEFEGTRRELSARVLALTSTPFVREGVAHRERQEEIGRGRQRITDAVEYIRNYLRESNLRRPDLSDQEGRLHGLAIARHLVYEMHLTGDEIRDVLDTLRDDKDDKALLETALLRGGTVEALLHMGVGGFQAYRARGEGFLAGVIRASRESLIADAPEQRKFSLPDRLIAAGGFVVGANQGIKDSIVSNVRGIVEMFTPSFWREMVSFFRDFLPRFIDNEDFRFELGQMLGRFDADEERRLAKASAFEYGRTYGHTFGMALTEIVLMFTGLGFLIEIAAESAKLLRIAKPLAKIAEAIAKTAIVARGLRIAQTIAEGINALSRRLRRLKLLLPDLTAEARLQRAMFEVEEAEELERLARKALAAGDEQNAQRRLQELSKTTDELDRRIGGAVKGEAGKGATPPREELPPGTAQASSAEQKRLLGKSGPLETGISDAQREAEIDIVRRSRPRPSTEPGYIDEVDIGNGHRWRREPDGTWCRFTKKSLCGQVIKGAADMPRGTDAEIAAARARVSNVSERADNISRVIENRQDIYRRVEKDRPRGQMTIRVDLLTEEEKTVLSDLFDMDLEELKPADLRNALEPRMTRVKHPLDPSRPPIYKRDVVPSEAERLHQKALAEVERAQKIERTLKTPLYKSMREASPGKALSQSVRDAAKGFDQISGQPPRSGRLAADHIVSLREIVDMPGFVELANADMEAAKGIANWRRNLQAMDLEINSTRGSASWADEFPGRNTYSDAAIIGMIKREAELRVELQNEIKRALAAVRRR